MLHLKDCPFCGSKPRVWVRSIPTASSLAGEMMYNGYISCTECTAKVRSAFPHAAGPEAAADAARNWNRRIDDA